MTLTKRRHSEVTLDHMVNHNYEKLIVVPDTHFPYEDKQSFTTMLNFIADQKPDRIVLIGDFIDMYSVSKFDKNPMRANKLQDEVDLANVGLRRLRQAAPQAYIVYLEGNHEKRMQSYIWRHPEIAGLRALEIPQLLGLDELGISYGKEYFWKETLLFTHGKKVGVNAVRQELLDNGVSGVSGHTHRVGSASKTDRSGEKVWLNVGHLADPKKAEYVENPDWMQGVGLAYLHKTKTRFFALVIPIVEHKFFYDGKLYTPVGIEKL